MEERIMKVGVIGIGGIAQKAYLPILCALPNVEILACTRNVETLKKVMSKYRLNHGMTEVSELLAMKPDAIFVCSATEAHLEHALAVIQAGIPLHLDKPATLDEASTRQIVELAQEKNVPLMVGFNRRFVPAVAKIKALGTPDLILHQKNRMIPQGDTIRHLVFDDYIHVVDTCRFLLGEPVIRVDARGTFKGDRLTQVVTHYHGKHSQAIGIMNYDNGTFEEIIEVMRAGEKWVVRQLDSVEHFHHDTQHIVTRSSWEATLSKRGFEAMITHFLNGVKTNTPFDPSPQDSLETHRLCELIVEQLEKNRID
jgi:virulence factor